MPCVNTPAGIFLVPVSYTHLAPLYRIAANAGLEGSVIINKVRESEPGIGFDALNEKYVDMVGEGILDPAKVTRSALQNATSVASTLLTTESAVAIIKEDLSLIHISHWVPDLSPGISLRATELSAHYQMLSW